MTTIREFLEEFISCLEDQCVSGVVPEDIDDLATSGTLDRELTRKQLVGGYNRVAAYLTGVIGREVDPFIVPNDGTNGHKVADALIESYEHWRADRREHGLSKNGDLPGVCKAFLAGCLSPSTMKPVVRLVGKLPLEEMWKFWLEIKAVIDEHPELRATYEQALEAHRNDPDFRELFPYVIATVIWIGGNELLEPKELGLVIEEAGEEYECEAHAPHPIPGQKPTLH